MNGTLLGLAMLVSAAGASPAPEPSRVLTVVSFELPKRAPRDLPGGLLKDYSGAPRRLGLAWSAQAAKPKRSRVDRIIAIAAGASVGWVVGGAIGYAVTPKRGPYDDTSGLKGVLIGAPIGGVAGALIGYRLTK